jgi:DNA polymerase III gamma/tau subunit
MNKIEKEEMFAHLKGFLKSKGIELQEGTYTKRIHQACGLLTDSVNLSQQALARAKTAVDKGLGQLRQTIHEKTAPKPPTTGAQPGTASSRSECTCDMGAAPKPTAKKSKTTKGRSRKK